MFKTCDNVNEFKFNKSIMDEAIKKITKGERAKIQKVTFDVEETTDRPDEKIIDLNINVWFETKYEKSFDSLCLVTICNYTEDDAKKVKEAFEKLKKYEQRNCFESELSI